ncbi:MAG: hypothetical protein IM638_11195 [Bacteroidetes bacterium]|nr:hypothetical protein [Bacteroidota bacterium]
MNPQTEQLKQRLHQKINSIEDAEYLAALDAVIAWETVPETNTHTFTALRNRLARLFSRRKKPFTGYYTCAAFR